MSNLSTREKLLFAQAVHKIGAGPTEAHQDQPVAEASRSTRKADAAAAQERDENWRKIADILREHPCSERSPDEWTVDRCRETYDELMTEAALVPYDAFLTLVPNAVIHLRLAQFFYKARMEQVRSEIEAQEEKFRTLVSEIDAIKSGQAVYNPAIVSEIRETIVRDRQRQAVERLKDASDASVAARAARGEQAQVVTIDLDVDVPEDWMPKADEFKDAAAGVIRSMAPKRDASPPVLPSSSPVTEAARLVEDDHGLDAAVAAATEKDDNEEEAEVENLAVGSSPAVEMTQTAPSTPVPEEPIVDKGAVKLDEESVRPDVEMEKSPAPAPAVNIEQPEPSSGDVVEAAASEGGKENGDGDDVSSTRSELTPPPASPLRATRAGSSPIPPPISPAVPMKSFEQSQASLKPPAVERASRVAAGRTETDGEGEVKKVEDEPLSSPPPQAIVEEQESAVDEDAEVAPAAESSPVEEAAGEHAATEEEDEDVKPVRRTTKRRASTRHVPATREEEEEEEEATPSGSRRDSKQTPERPTKGRGKEEAAEPSRPARGARRSTRARETEDTAADEDAEAAVDQPEEAAPALRTRASRSRQAMDETDEEEDARPRKQAKVDSKPTRATRGKPAPLAEENKREAQTRRRVSGTTEDVDEDVAEVKKEEDRASSRATQSPAVTARATRAAAAASGTSSGNRNFKRVILQLFEEIRSHKNAPLFAMPIKESDAPGYHDVVKRPMDLKKIKANINSGKTATIDDFQRDLWLMFCNAMMFNRPGSQPYVMAKEMMAWCENKLMEHRNAEHHVR